MTEFKMPTEGEKAATANVLRNIVNLIKSGLYFGSNAGFVQEALSFLENTANNMTPTSTPEEKSEEKKEWQGQKKKKTFKMTLEKPE